MKIKNNDSRCRSKAAWLNIVRRRVTRSVVDDFVVCTCGEWIAKPACILDRIESHFSWNHALIIRSSAVGEDLVGDSLAGAFHSEPGILSSDRASLSVAIENVAKSFNKGGRERKNNDEIIIQRFVEDVTLSGVILTYDLWSSYPYYVITFDNDSRRTDTVTSGQAGKNVRIPRGTNLCSIDDKNWQRVLYCVEEIEHLFGEAILDIEFALTSDGVFHVFQVREVSSRAILTRTLPELPNWSTIKELQGQLCELLKQSSQLSGDRTVFTDMSDWNPAEMLGSLPYPLDTSIYRYLITKSAWNVARSSMGYTDVGNTELMVTLGHKPYIDARVSINSLTPSSVPSRIRHFIVNYGVDKLCSAPELQDKIEFDIVFSCFDLQVDNRLTELRNTGLTTSELNTLHDILIKTTNRIFRDYRKMIRSDLVLIESLNKTTRIPANSSMSVLESINAIRSNLDKCREYGIIPFSRLARLAFIGLAFLRSLRAGDLLFDGEYEAFFRTLTTVAQDVSVGWRNLSKGKISFEEFLDLFGHLRPRTYDITSACYSQYPHEFWDKFILAEHRMPATEDIPVPTHAKQIEHAIAVAGIKCSTSELFDFARKAIEAREYAKFVFSRHISDALELLNQVGERIGLSREDMAFLTLNDIFSLLGKTENAPKTMLKHLMELTERRRAERIGYLQIALPPVLRDPSDLVVVSYYAARPNFVTQEVVQAPVIYIREIGLVVADEISGKIVLLDRADPGFDWIFEYAPAGLITQFGGVGSHMTIRCGEFGLPAAIGCGETLFSILTRASVIILDCESKMIVPVKLGGS